MRQATTTHIRILGYLGRALSLEYSAIQQYMTQAVLTESWGLTDAAVRFRQETVEEMQHADRIIQQMLRLGVVPNASQLNPARPARNLVDLLQHDVALEAEIVALYAEATRFCERLGDVENGEFFNTLLQEELEHARSIEDWLKSLGVPPGYREGERVYF